MLRFFNNKASKAAFTHEIFKLNNKMNHTRSTCDTEEYTTDDENLTKRLKNFFFFFLFFSEYEDVFH